MRRAAAGAAVAAMTLAGCSPGLPKGVTQESLDEAVSRAIGDPNTCLLIGERPGGRVIYRYNTHTICGRKLPACDAPRLRSVNELLRATAKDGQPRGLSCYSSADQSRGVGWASGVIAGKHPLVFAAVMEGPQALPGRIMAEKLDGALQDAGFQAGLAPP